MVSVIIRNCVRVRLRNRDSISDCVKVSVRLGIGIDLG